MADVNYIITIKNDTMGSSGTGAIAQIPSGGSVNGNNNSGDNVASRMAPLAVAATKKAAITLIRNEVNRVELRTGHANLQERYSFALSTASSALGAVLGGSLLGGGLGAIGGLLYSALSWTYDTVTAQQNLEIARVVENEGIRLANIRASSGGDRIGRNE